MSTNDDKNGPKSDYESDYVSANGTTDNTQTGKPKEKKEMFQRGNRSDLIFGKYQVTSNCLLSLQHHIIGP